MVLGGLPRVTAIIPEVLQMVSEPTLVVSPVRTGQFKRIW
jgi:hypothetical protein